MGMTIAEKILAPKAGARPWCPAPLMTLVRAGGISQLLEKARLIATKV